MPQLLRRLLGAFVDIHPGERKKTFLMFCSFFLIIALIYILKPVRSSLFLTELGAQNLRFMYMGEGFFLILVVAVYVYLSKRIPKNIFSVLVPAFFISNLLIFWFLFRRNTPYLSAFFYVWVASFSITMTTQFWILANDIFNPAEAKRLFGLIISGGSLGGVMGGFFTQAAVRWLKTEDLLLGVAGLLFLCGILNFLIWKKVPARDWMDAAPSDPSPGKSPDPREKRRQAANSSDFTVTLMNPARPQIVRRSSYLIMLALIVIIAKIASTIIDNQFSRSVELAILGKDDRTAFLGGFMASLNGVSLLIQLFLTSLCLRYLGIGFSLQLLPLGLAAFSIFSFLSPALLIPSLLLKTFDGSVNYSIQQASKEVLFLPLSSSLRRRVKPIIDMLGFRGAKTLGGLYIAVAAPFLGLSDERLGILVLTLMPLWFFLAWQMRKNYSDLLRHHLLHRWPHTEVVKAQRATDVLSFLYDEKNWHQIQFLINHPSSYTRKIAATACLAYTRSQNLASARRLVERMIREEAFQVHQSLNSLEDELTHDDYWFFIHRVFLNGRPEALNRAAWKDYLQSGPQEILNQLEKILENRQEGLDAKRRAVRLLGFIVKQEALDLLLKLSSETQDHAFRFVIAKALDQMHEKDPKLAINPASIKTEIAREVKIYKNFQKLIFFYDRQTKSGNPKYLRVALKTVLDESLERLFHYLDLLYPLEMMHNIHAWIVEHPESDPVRQQAVELLSNTVEPDVLLILGSVLEPNSSSTEEEEAVGILEGLAGFEDRWFSLIGIFVVSELQWNRNWPQLEKIKREPRFHEILGS